ncbi:MAG: alkaline phosphatase D family protein [Pseudomonadota bacterium]|uniref:alkaline phosphatase D family protein n=1 Tax=Thermithiobacillus tepidarius TaxID=929 RepID=UPI00138AC3DC|nr:alkaline phosphatase D family protein [Thermithiobacillus tepidarius]
MDRRRFLKAMLATGSTAWLVGCYSDGVTQSSYGNPVSFQSTGQAAGLLNADLLAEDFQIDPAIDPNPIFSLSVASGDPRPHGIVLWTRVDPQAMANPQKPGTVAFEIATDPGFARNSVRVRGLAQLDPARDYTVKLPIEHDALAPFQHYYYRFIYQKAASRTGRFKTLPAPDAAVERVSFAFASCQDYSNGYYTALAHLARESVDFIVFLGDYIYETVSDPSFQGAQVRPVPPLPSGQTAAADLADYRHLYRVYKADPNAQALHEQFTFIQLWDDHEFANDCHQDYHPDNNPSPETPTPALRQAANQAWSEYGLADVSFDPQRPPLESIRTYRSFRFGQLMELVATDERLYRDGPVCGNDTLQRYLSLRCAAAESPARTMLGASQRDWFLDTMRQSTATWKLWANEVTLMQMRVLAGFVNLDQWDGYPAERANLLSSLALSGVKNLVAITGDIHSFIAGYLKTDFDDLSAPVGVELVVGSVTSANLLELAASQVPLPSAPLPLPIPTPAGMSVESVLMASNPHMRYFNSSTHGYCLMEVRPEAATCVMKAVSTIREPQATVSTLRTFVIPRDRVELVPV